MPMHYNVKVTHTHTNVVRTIRVASQMDAATLIVKLNSLGHLAIMEAFNCYTEEEAYQIWLDFLEDY